MEDSAKNMLRKSGVNLQDKTTGLEALVESGQKTGKIGISRAH